MSFLLKKTVLSIASISCHFSVAVEVLFVSTSCLLPVAVGMLFISTASGSRLDFHVYCHFWVAVELAVAFQSGYLFREFPLDSLSASRFLFEFTICFANSPWIHDFFFETTMNSLWNHYKTTLNSLWTHFRLRDFTRNSCFFANLLSVSSIFYEFTRICYKSIIFFVNSSWTN